MKRKWEEFKASLQDVKCFTKKEYLLTMGICLLGGIAAGMIFSPRNFLMIGSMNGNNNPCGVKENAAGDIEEERV